MDEIAEQQRAHWNSSAADKWVEHQARLDGQMTPLTDILLDKAAIKAGESVIDIGCGCGTTTRKAAASTGAGGQVMGVDISAPLLTVAAQQSVDDHVSFFEGDAGSLPLPVSDADLVMSRFGVMFFADPVAAFTHLRGNLKSGGRLAFVCWSQLEDNPWFNLPLQVLNTLHGFAMPLSASSEVPTYAPGPMAFANTGVLEKILQDARFTAIEIETLDVPLFAGNDLVDAARFMLFMGPSSRIVTELNLDDSAVEQVIDEIVKQIEIYRTDDGIQVASKLHYVRAINV